jgi:16S rRNA (uracil1498-N3)-methyltransferase
VIAAIGPEGGFTTEEVQHAVAAGWTTVDLGSRILRVETAAVALAAWCALNGQQNR